MDRELVYGDHLTEHAIMRYQERVENVPPATVWERLSTNLIKNAIKFGFTSVKLPSGQKAIIKNGKIVTILDKEWRYRKF